LPIMSFLKRKKKQAPSHMPLLQAEASSARTAPSPSPRQSSTPSPLAEPSARAEVDEIGQEDTGPEDMLDATFIGRTIKLIRAENWEQDLLPTMSQDTQILYENQRGYVLLSSYELTSSMFLFGKPYFSCNSLIHSLKFDPPAYQRTDSFLSSHPGTIDPSDPSNKFKSSWPPDPLKLYYSPYSPHDALLSLDSMKGNGWRWKQDRWYVDMRGDVDEEGWEYAFYWNGRYWWCGGNWHGKSVFVHGWVRRRKWIRELHRIEVHPATLWGYSHGIEKGGSRCC